MKANCHFSSAAVARANWQPTRWTAMLRYVALIVVGAVSTSCGHDVPLENPHTGAIEVCQESRGGFKPWSQTMGCVADHVAQGWTRTGQE
jgi:hypothetical protein